MIEGFVVCRSADGLVYSIRNRSECRSPLLSRSNPSLFMMNLLVEPVIQSGAVTRSISQLVRDTRKLMEPNTASRLRVLPLLLAYAREVNDHPGTTPCPTA